MSSSTPSTPWPALPPSSALAAVKKAAAERNDVEDMRMLLQQQVHNILTLQQEVAELKYAQSAAKTEMYHSVDLRVRELKEQISREKEDRSISWSMLCDKIVNAESDIKALQPTGDAGSDELAQLKGSFDKMNQRVDELEKLMGDSVAEQRQKANESIEAWRAMKDSHQALMEAVRNGLPTQLVPRMDRLEAALEERVKKADASKAETERLVGDAQTQMTEYINKITKARGDYHDSVKDRLQEFNDNLHEMMKLQQKALVSTEEKLKQVADRLQTFKDEGVSSNALENVKSSLQEEQARSEKAMTEMRAAVDGVQGMLKEFKAKNEEEREEMSGENTRALDQLRTAHAKLTEFITRDAETRALYHDSVHERLAHLENTLGDISLSHSKVMEITHDQFEASDARLSTCEDNTRNMAEAIHLKADRSALEVGTKELESKLDSLRGRVDAAATAAGESSAKVADTVGAAQTRIAEYIAREVGASEQREALAKERSDRVDSQLRDVLERRAEDSKRLDLQEERINRAQSKLEERLKGMETKLADGGPSQLALENLRLVQREMEARDRSAEDVAAAPTTAEKQASELALAKKVSEMEGALADVLASHRQQQQLQELATAAAPPRAAEAPKVIQTQAVLPPHVKEALDTMQRKLDYLEQHASSSNTLQAKSLRATHEKFQQVHGRLVACESSAVSPQGPHTEATGLEELLEGLEQKILEALDTYGEELEAVKRSQQFPFGSLEELRDRVSFLEVATKDDGDAQRKDLEATNQRLAELAADMASDRSALEDHHKQVKEFFEGEKSAHDADVDSLKERIGEIATSHAAAIKLTLERSSQELQNQDGVFKDLMQQLEERLSVNLDGLKSELGDEKMVGAQREKETLDRLEGERKAREALDNSLQSALFVDTKSREALERWVKEHQGHEQASRERHQAHVQELLRAEKEERQRQQEMQQEYIKREVEAHEAQLRSLYEVLEREAAMRDAHQRSVQKAHENMEERIERDKQEQVENLHGATVRIHQLERGVEEALGAERADRQADVAGLWHAMDNHTHDLDTGPALAPSSSRSVPYATEKPSVLGGYPRVRQAEVLGYGASGGGDLTQPPSPGGASGPCSPSIAGGVQLASSSPWGGGGCMKPDFLSNTVMTDRSNQSTPGRGARQVVFTDPSPRFTPWP